MLQIEIITVGKIKSSWIQEGIDHYLKLLSKYAGVKVTCVKESDSATMSVEQVLAGEAERIRKAIQPRSQVMLLDAAGKQYDSSHFSQLISRVKLANSQIQLIIGGAFGLSEELKHEYRNHISMSAMTFPHELAVMMLIEQLYRACSIEVGSKYHK